MNIQYGQREYPVIGGKTVNGVHFAAIDISTRPGMVMRHYVLVGAPVPTPIERAHAQLEQDIAAARDVWRKIVFVPDAPVVRLEPDALLSVNDSRNVTVIPSEAA